MTISFGRYSCASSSASSWLIRPVDSSSLYAASWLSSSWFPAAQDSSCVNITETDIHRAAQDPLTLLCCAETRQSSLGCCAQDPAGGTRQEKSCRYRSGPCAPDRCLNACDLRALERCEAVAWTCWSSLRLTSSNLAHRSKADTPFVLKRRRVKVLSHLCLLCLQVQSPLASASDNGRAIFGENIRRQRTKRSGHGSGT